MKDILSLIGIDAAGFGILSIFRPDLVKLVLVFGLIALLGIFAFTRHGRVAIYGSQLVMTLLTIVKLS